MNIQNKKVSFCLLILITQSAFPMSFVKKMGVGFGSVFVGLSIHKQVNLSAKERLYVEISEDANMAYPEIHDVFLKIKDHLAIKKDVKLRILSKIDNNNIQKILAIAPSLEGWYSNYTDTVYIGCDKITSKSKLIHNIIHELEHHRQFYKYPKSYPFSYQYWDRNEYGADRCAAENQCCLDCLKNVANDVLHEYVPHDTHYGHVTSTTGYFAKEGYEPYIKKALEKNTKCLAHKLETHLDADTPLADFLSFPTITK